MSQLLENLNKEQQQVIINTKGKYLVLSGAGSGKTRCLTYKIAYLIEQGLAEPQNILAVTFTNKAAQEMKERIVSLVGKKSARWWIGTFHGICVRILVRYGEEIGIPKFFTIADEKEQEKEMKAILAAHESEKMELEELKGIISWAKNNLVRPGDLTEGNVWGIRPVVGQLYEEYQERLQKMNTLDFDDLILRTIDLFNAVPYVKEKFQEQFKYILVDESQDLNLTQFEFLKIISGKYENLTLIGDIDQNIYSWRGATLDIIMAFANAPDTKVIKLEQNYRSCKNIVDASNELIKKNENRLDKTLWTDKQDGEKIIYHRADTEYEEAEFVASVIDYICNVKGSKSYKDFAILYRTNNQSRILEEKLSALFIPYQIVGGLSFYERKEVKDMIAYLRILVNPYDILSFQRVANEPKRGVGAVALLALVTFMNKEGVNITEALDRLDEIKKPDGKNAITTKSKEALSDLNEILKTFRERMHKLEPARLIKDYATVLGYLDMLETNEEEDRILNVYELANIASEKYDEVMEDYGPCLESFVRDLNLVSDMDTVESDDNTVKLMTTHTSKGLEFQIVFMIGMEENIFPHFMALSSDKKDIEEERRLCYVSMTRAMERLYILNAKERRIFGRVIKNLPSRFIKEIPNRFIKKV